MDGSYRPNGSQRKAHTAEAHAQLNYIHGSQDVEQDVAAAPTTGQDVIGQVLGDFGIWQLRSVLIIFLCKLPAAWFMALIIFTAPELYPNEEYWCDTSVYSGMGNTSVSADQCSVLVAYGEGNFAMRQCQQFNYAHSFRSLIMEFDLVCLCDIFVAWSQYWHLFGMFVGGVVATRLMRVLSPRRVYISGIWGLLGCGTATGLVNDFSLHCSFRCLSAVCCCLMMTAGQVICGYTCSLKSKSGSLASFILLLSLVSDITAGKGRQSVLLLYDSFWSIGVILLPAIAAFAHSWRQIYVGITSLPFAFVLLLPWLPDSPRWMLQHAEPTAAVEHVQQLLQHAARINERSHRLTRDLGLQLELLSERLRTQPAPARWLELWHGHPQAKLHMLATHMALATFLISHMGLLLNIRSFGRDYLAPNTMAIGLAELIGCLLAVYLCLWHNFRKWQWAGGFCIVGGAVGCLCWFFNDVQSGFIYIYNYIYIQIFAQT